MGYNGYTEKKKVSNQKYAEKFERPHLRMTAEEKILIEKAAAKIGQSFNRFVVDSALEKAQGILTITDK